ncbi:hypothetical protein CFP56_001032 [Quercus suber]|uniref:Uncharacterized protein n=1 Tax=Quercus suber TaxID=58331 RepID=A0AAW0LHI8_QUESU
MPSLCSRKLLTKVDRIILNFRSFWSGGHAKHSSLTGHERRMSMGTPSISRNAALARNISDSGITSLKLLISTSHVRYIPWRVSANERARKKIRHSEHLFESLTTPLDRSETDTKCQMNHHHQTLAPLKAVVEQPPLTLYFADVFQLQRSFPLLLYSGQRCRFLCSSVSPSSDHSLSMTAATTSICLMYVNLWSPFLYQCPARPPIYPSSDQSSHPLVIRVAILLK